MHLRNKCFFTLFIVALRLHHWCLIYYFPLADTKLGSIASSPKPPSPSLPMPKQTPQSPLAPTQPLQSMIVRPSKDGSTGRRGLVLRAVNEIEHQFWDYPLVEREDSYVMLSLYHIQKLFRFQLESSTGLVKLGLFIALQLRHENRF